ncbi:MAG: type II secretion system protein GspG [Luteolibacter sp.]
MKNVSSHQSAKGFTLIELLVVVAIIAILAALSIGGFNYVSNKQAYSTAELQINLLSKALEEYKLDNGEYPTTTSTNGLFLALYWEGANTTPPGKIYLSELDPINNKQAWTSGTGASTAIIDPWGNQYIYRNGSTPSARNPDFDLLSTGPDGNVTTEGDNVSNFN